MSSVWHSYWNVANPAAGTVLANWTPAAGAGTYEVDIYPCVSGTLILSDMDNLGVYLTNGAGTTLLTRVPMPALVNLPINRITVYPVFTAITDYLEIKTISGSGLLSSYRGLAVGKPAQF
jgi:hypothetical protein